MTDGIKARAGNMVMRSVSIYKLMGVLVLSGFNLAFAAFFILWSIADSAAVNGMEAVSGYDPAAMLPNANLMWLAAYASLILLIAVDVCAVALYVKTRKASSSSSQMQIGLRS